MKENNIKIGYDASTDILTVYGVKFSLDIFKIFAEPKKGHAYKFERDGETVIVTDLGLAPELETACLASAQPRLRNYERR